MDAKPTAFYRSANGDIWSLEYDADSRPVVIHQANAASGGYVTRTDAEIFLNAGVRNPEHEALSRIIGTVHQKEASYGGSDIIERLYGQANKLSSGSQVEASEALEAAHLFEEAAEEIEFLRSQARTSRD